MLIAGRHSLVRGNSPGSRERRASGPGWRLCWPRDSSAPRSISGDAGYVGQGEITCDSTCIYDVPYRPSRPLLRGHIISQLRDGTLLSRLSARPNSRNLTDVKSTVSERASRRTLSPSSCVRRSTSRIFLIDTLIFGIDCPAVFVDRGCRSADSNVDGNYADPLIYSCPQSLE